VKDNVPLVKNIHPTVIFVLLTETKTSLQPVHVNSTSSTISLNAKNVLTNVPLVSITEKPTETAQDVTVLVVPLTESTYHSVSVQKDIMMTRSQIVNNAELHVLLVTTIPSVPNVNPDISYTTVIVSQNAQPVSGVISPIDSANHVTKPV
jgi:hypothetical protein